MLIKLIIILLLCVSQADAFGTLYGVSSSGASFGTGAGAASYLLSENFDGASACGDGSHTNCNNTWTKVGNMDEDFNYATSPAPLEGTYSARLSGVVDEANDGYVISFTAQDTVYFYFIFNPTVRATGKLVQLLDASDNILMRVEDAGPEFAIYCNNNLQYSTAIVAETTYHVWGDYTKGTGANAACHLYHATTSTKPGSPNITETSGNATGQASKIKVTKDGNTQDLIFDKIRVSTSAIGSTPD